MLKKDKETYIDWMHLIEHFDELHKNAANVKSKSMLRAAERFYIHKHRSK